ncbi:MAG: family 10 glycosylhydrolase [Bacteroidetes bacterium]|nr:family 10 glycosylhydrolase [Bacteroidota bacterium]
MKQIFFFIVFFMQFTFSQNGTSASFPITATDPQNFRDYPGGRGENQLIVYTPAYGKKSTGTNQWGLEAVVRENCIVAVGGNNSPIHEDEIILSGHGKAKSFLEKNAHIGAKVAVINGNVEISFDAESFAVFSQLVEKDLRKKFSLLKNNFNEETDSVINHLFDSLHTVTATALQYAYLISDEKVYSLGMQLLDELSYRISVSPKIEARGIFHRPTERGPEQIAEVVKTFAEAGFNQIYLETVWRGEAIYPSFITQQRRRFRGFDPLQTYINEAEKYGIEIHALLHTFSAGGSTAPGDTGKGPVLEQHPAWQIVKRNGERFSNSEQGAFYLNPALPEVQEYIASLYKEVRTQYPKLAGIQMDDICYPTNVPLDESSDYSEYSRTEFQKYAGVDPMNINPTDNPLEWEKWRKWREEIITAFVKKIRWQNPEILLSADVTPDFDEAVITQMQNWSEWAKKGYVNFLVPNVFSLNTDWVEEVMTRIEMTVGKDFPTFAGLVVSKQLPPALLLQQIEKVREMGIPGIVLFSSQEISNEQLRLLSVGPFREKAVPPVILRTQSQVKGETH